MHWKVRYFTNSIRDCTFILKAHIQAYILKPLKNCRHVFQTEHRETNSSFVYCPTIFILCFSDDCRESAQVFQISWTGHVSLYKTNRGPRKSNGCEYWRYPLFSIIIWWYNRNLNSLVMVHLEWKDEFIANGNFSFGESDSIPIPLQFLWHPKIFLINTKQSISYCKPGSPILRLPFYTGTAFWDLSKLDFL